METPYMYVHHAVGSLQKPGALSRRQRHLSDLMVVCNLSTELGATPDQEALLDWLVRHTSEFTPVAFSKVLTSEADGSFVYRAVFQENASPESIRKNQPAPPAAWPFYARVTRNGRQPTLIQRKDPGLSAEQRRALGLHQARRIWIVPLRDSAENNLGVLVLGERRGASTQIDQPQVDFLTQIAEHAATALQSARRSLYSEDGLVKLILALAEAIDATDPESHNHSYRTANLAVAIATHYGLTEEQVQNIRWAGLLHDIGKLEISEDILRKPGPLTPEEWQVIRQHPLTGAEILKPVTRLRAASAIIRAHHERYDGSGYPYGLRGEDIPFEARILTVADAYCVMIQGRIYRGAMTQPDAIAELKRCSGAHFDPRVVAVLLEIIDRGILY